jgi:hypothetical protein
MFHIELTFNFAYLYVIAACGLGFLYGIYNWLHVHSLSTDAKFGDDEPDRRNLHPDQIIKMNATAEKIKSVK